MTRGGRSPGNEIAVTFENVCRVTYETSRLNDKNVQVQYVCHCCFFLLLIKLRRPKNKGISSEDLFMQRQCSNKQTKTRTSISENRKSDALVTY